MQRITQKLLTPTSVSRIRSFAAPSATQLSSYSTTATRNELQSWHGTTILCVRKDGKVCMMGDGQVSMGNMVVKPNARKIRRIFPKSLGGKEQKDGAQTGVIVGFAGSTADAFTLLERLEGKLDEYPGQLARSCVELAKGWRTDKYLRRLEASLLVADENVSLEITGNGDVLESFDKVLSVGSGSPFAMAAARALQDQEGISAEDICRKAMDIASDMCVYTNKCYKYEVMDTKDGQKSENGGNDEKKD
jgi:ATP-dependent HslUV protease subunit HslV